MLYYILSRKQYGFNNILWSYIVWIYWPCVDDQDVLRTKQSTIASLANSVTKNQSGGNTNCCAISIVLSTCPFFFISEVSIWCKNVMIGQDLWFFNVWHEPRTVFISVSTPLDVLQGFWFVSTSYHRQSKEFWICCLMSVCLMECDQLAIVCELFCLPWSYPLYIEGILAVIAFY